MNAVLSPEERNALYEQILVRLSGIGDIWIALAAERFDTAERLAAEYADELRLVLDDLGFGEGTGQAIELSAPREVLRRVLGRLRELAEGEAEQTHEEWAQAAKVVKRHRLVVKTCDRILPTL
jgi:hypothetical protein